MSKADRGFASMNVNRQREIASQGGKAAHKKGTAHRWTSEEAREAGRKGGTATARARALVRVLAPNHKPEETTPEPVA